MKVLGKFLRSIHAKLIPSMLNIYQISNRNLFDVENVNNLIFIRRPKNITFFNESRAKGFTKVLSCVMTFSSSIEAMIPNQWQYGAICLFNCHCLAYQKSKKSISPGYRFVGVCDLNANISKECIVSG